MKTIKINLIKRVLITCFISVSLTAGMVNCGTEELEDINLGKTNNAICGNNNIESGEDCDDGATQTINCESNCKSPACGDGILNLAIGEQCDDANNIDSDGCSSICWLENCGDYNLDNGEQCDDGNNINGDGCSSICQLEDAICGNGILQAGEECDGGGMQTATCEENCILSVCGDNIINSAAGEACDDGNTTDGDGCSSTCQIGIVTNDLSLGTAAYVNAITGATIDNGSDSSDMFHTYINLINSDGSVRFEYDFVTGCDFLPISGSGAYIFSNYNDANGVTINGTLNFYIVYNGSATDFDYVFQGSLVYTGAVNYTTEYNYMYNFNGSTFTYNGYIKIGSEYFVYNSDGTISTTAIISIPVFNPPVQVTGDACGTGSSVAELIITPITTEFSENNGTGSFSVALNRSPSSNVVLNIVSNNTSKAVVDQSSLTFTTGDWDIAQTITLTGIDNNISSGDQSVYIDISPDSGLTFDITGFQNLPPYSITVTALDDDSAGIIVTPVTSVFSENNGSGSFTVQLNSEPNGDVAIDILSAETTEASVDKSSLTFTAATWNTIQTVNLTGIDDFIVDGNKTFNIILTIDSTSTYDTTGYLGINPDDVSVTVQDDDIAGITVTPVKTVFPEVSSNTGSFSVVLNTQPNGDVSIDITNGDSTEVSIDKSNLIFNDTNWNTLQTVYLTGIDDTIKDGDQTFTISLTINNGLTTDTTGYDIIDPDDISVTIIDPLYYDNLDGTVLDIGTASGEGLIWQKCSNGQTYDGTTCSGNAVTLNWVNAISYCANLVTGGKAWRLPSTAEIQSIIDTSYTNPAIDEIYFPSTAWTTTSVGYWTASTDTLGVDYAWFIDFGNYGPYGSGGEYGGLKTSSYYVRCVSAGLDDVEIFVTQDTTGIGNNGYFNFDSVYEGSSGSPYTFTISNYGISDLVLSGTPNVNISGTDAGDFIVTQPALSTITSGTNTIFTVEFNPAIAGAKNAIITIENNDVDLPTYNINLTATALAIPFINNGDGTITDNDGTGAGLMWQQSYGSIYAPTYTKISDYCGTLTLGGYSDWRLPSLTELGYIMPDGESYFSGDAFYQMASSSTCTDTYTGAGVYHRRMYLGSTYCWGFSYFSSNSTYVRCVR